MPDYEPVAVADAPVLVADLFLHAGLASSRSDARRLISQGGAYVNNRRVADAGRVLEAGDLLHGRWAVLRRGRREVSAVEVLPAGVSPDEGTAPVVLMRVSYGSDEK